MIIRIPERVPVRELPLVFDKITEIALAMGAHWTSLFVLDIDLHRQHRQVDLMKNDRFYGVELRHRDGHWEAFTDGVPTEVPVDLRLPPPAYLFGPIDPRIGPDTKPWDTSL